MLQNFQIEDLQLIKKKDKVGPYTVQTCGFPCAALFVAIFPNQMKILITKAGKKDYMLVGRPNPAKLANFLERELMDGEYTMEFRDVINTSSYEIECYLAESRCSSFEGRYVKSLIFK